jgi:glutathione S-transferase
MISTSRLRGRHTMSTVKFYDLLSAHPEIWWSPNTYKTRFLLNYKEIPYTVIPTHYPDIRDVSLKLNLAEDRYPKWPLPIIEHDGNVIRGSLDIARYLDSAFPERRLMGEECEKWQQYISKNVLLAVWPMTGSMVPTILDERDAKFFRDTRKVPERIENHAKVVEAMSLLIEGIKRSGYIYGGRIHYADFVLGSIFVWILRTKEEDFQKIMKAAGIEEWWQKIAVHM